MEITDRVAVQLPRKSILLRHADRAMCCGNLAMVSVFQYIYRHHRRYRITEGAEEIQIRKVAGKLFGYSGRAKG